MVSAILLSVGALLFAGGSAEDVNTRSDYGHFDSIRVAAETVLEYGENCVVHAEVPSRYTGDIQIKNDGGTLIIEAVGHARPK